MHGVSAWEWRRLCEWSRAHYVYRNVKQAMYTTSKTVEAQFNLDLLLCLVHCKILRWEMFFADVPAHSNILITLDSGVVYHWIFHHPRSNIRLLEHYFPRSRWFWSPSRHAPKVVAEMVGGSARLPTIFLPKMYIIGESNSRFDQEAAVCNWRSALFSSLFFLGSIWVNWRLLAHRRTLVRRTVQCRRHTWRSLAYTCTRTDIRGRWSTIMTSHHRRCGVMMQSCVRRLQELLLFESWCRRPHATHAKFFF